MQTYINNEWYRSASLYLGILHIYIYMNIFIKTTFHLLVHPGHRNKHTQNYFEKFILEYIGISKWPRKQKQMFINKFLKF